jgi:hypothetical protein
METFSEAAIRHLDDEALGWFARRAAVGSYGMLCRASLNSPDLGVALRHWPRHNRLLVAARITSSADDCPVGRCRRSPLPTV